MIRKTFVYEKKSMLFVYMYMFGYTAELDYVYVRVFDDDANYFITEIAIPLNQAEQYIPNIDLLINDRLLNINSYINCDCPDNISPNKFRDILRDCFAGFDAKEKIIKTYISFHGV